MALLDHLVPAFSGEAYGDRGLLDDLPVGVWLTSTIRPMQMETGNLLTLQLVKGRPDQFRYQVIVTKGGKRRVMRGDVEEDEGKTVIRTGVGFLSSVHSDLLPKVQHQDFANTAAVDPKQDWPTEERSLNVDFDLGGVFDEIFLYAGAATATAAIGGYLLYRRFRKRSLPERSNRALPKGKV